MAEAKKCDRCGKLYSINLFGNLDKEWNLYKILKECYPDSESHYIDLCDDCKKELYEWLTEGRIQNDGN